MLLSYRSESQKTACKKYAERYTYTNHVTILLSKKINGPRIEMKIFKLNSYLTGITAYQKMIFLFITNKHVDSNKYYSAYTEMY